MKDLKATRSTRAMAIIGVSLIIVLAVCIRFINLSSSQEEKRNPFLEAAERFKADQELLAQVQKHGAMIRITDKPYKMSEIIYWRCSFDPAGPQPQIPFDISVHADRYCDVFVSENARNTMMTGQGQYPQGSLIIKAKYPNQVRKETELFTAMRKMEPGYSPEHGDWEFSVIDGKAKRVLSRGRLDSCAECHDGYPKSDFVTRVYLWTETDWGP